MVKETRRAFVARVARDFVIEDRAALRAMVDEAEQAYRDADTRRAAGPLLEMGIDLDRAARRLRDALAALHELRDAPGQAGRPVVAAAAEIEEKIEALYATRLGPWSEAHYGAVARNFWAGGFHFYQVAGRFAAPFVLWWTLEKDHGRP